MSNQSQAEMDAEDEAIMGMVTDRLPREFKADFPDTPEGKRAMLQTVKRIWYTWFEEDLMKDPYDAIKAGKSADDLVRTGKCFHCLRLALPGQTYPRCQKCKAVGYCSLDCQKVSWKKGSSTIMVFPTPHKLTCPVMARNMERTKDAEDLAKWFPWCKLRTNGTFDLIYYLASINLLGGEGFGYWTMNPNNDYATRDLARDDMNRTPLDELIAGSKPKVPFLHGSAYLNPLPLSDDECWHGIPQNQRASYTDGALSKLTKLTTQLESWEEWYKWRKLSLESPAALVMHNVMTIYFMLTEILNYHNVISEEDGRKAFSFHLLGPTSELDMLGTFAELALLLPGMDVQVVLIGPAVFELCKDAPTGSLADGGGILMRYQAPKHLGGGTVAVKAHSKQQIWNSQNGPEMTNQADYPFALIALNAALPVYKEWIEVTATSLLSGIPMLATERMEVLVEETQKHLEDQCDILIKNHLGKPHTPEVTKDNLARKKVRLEEGGAKKAFPCIWNPFQKPGPRRSGAHVLPSMDNGFILKI